MSSKRNKQNRKQHSSADKLANAVSTTNHIQDKRNVLIDFFLQCSEAWGTFGRGDQSGLCFDIADKIENDSDESYILAVWHYCESNWVGSELDRLISKSMKA